MTIESELERQQETHPELQLLTDDRLRGFFVKNLENVQGDERDILIFSIGYGPDENGKFTLQFGPINKKGGERRLNVAITRARRRVEVVASVTAADFHGDANSDGVRHLKRYLDFAERKDKKIRALAIDLSSSTGDVESPFEEEVMRVVRSWGYDVVPQVGCADYRIDLAVRHPGEPGSFALGIECDGAAYHSAMAARDRDRLRQEILEGLGWKLHRIWGPAWFHSRNEQEERLRRAIESAVLVPGRGVARPLEPETRPITTIDEVDLEALPNWTLPYEVASPRKSTRSVEMHQPEAHHDLARMIEEVVRIEGPVAESLVLKRLREAWSVQRAGSRIRERFEKCLGYLVWKNVIRRGDGILWLHNQELTAVRVPGSSEASARDIEEVPRAELELALRRLVEDAGVIATDELGARVARLFGWARRGRDIHEALQSSVRSLLAAGVLIEEEGSVRLSG
jgi:very-short-patch-repair endonuclease